MNPYGRPINRGPDIQIIDALDRNPHASVRMIARELGCTHNAVQGRLQRLRREGIIHHREAERVIHANKLDCLTRTRAHRD
jgi:predicted transcriptional regulator